MPCHLVPRHLVPHHLVPCHPVPLHLVPYHLVPLHLMFCYLVPHHPLLCHLVFHHLVPHHLVPCHLVLFHLVPCHLDLPPRTLLLILAQRWVPGRVTTWRYVGSTCQPGEVGSFMWVEGPASWGERTLEASFTRGLSLEPLGGPSASGTQWEHVGPLWDLETYFGSPAT